MMAEVRLYYHHLALNPVSLQSITARINTLIPNFLTAKDPKQEIARLEEKERQLDMNNAPLLKRST